VAAAASSISAAPGRRTRDCPRRAASLSNLDLIITGTSWVLLEFGDAPIVVQHDRPTCRRLRFRGAQPEGFEAGAKYLLKRGYR
jgi:hypothetical protein